jgi:hypothetical protein
MGNTHRSFYIHKMSTNIPSYQNGSPHPIDNEPPHIVSKLQPSFKTMQAAVVTRPTNDPKTIQEAIGNIRASLSGLSNLK